MATLHQFSRDDTYMMPYNLLILSHTVP